jgi:hypothetical protein
VRALALLQGGGLGGWVGAYRQKVPTIYYVHLWYSSPCYLVTMRYAL